MYFSRLRLNGFKSFVDPTELLIEPGLTGVVGPNGCGKSNLLEAIRWVMGENRAKSLRGTGMEDVIFAGTTKRAARRLAEVSLVLDNNDRTAPPLHNDKDLIEVTRRIERESGSAYRINGNDVRMKDVQLLFADAATGAHSPALVSQGRIGALINAKPQERRAILEEAAGISGLHTRRKEAEQKLKAAENNLIRLQDMMQGMEGQANSLKRQARQARRYREVSEEIERAVASLMVIRWREAAAEVLLLERGFTEAQEKVAQAAQKLAEETNKHNEAANVMPALRVELSQRTSKLQAQQQELSNLRADRTRRIERAELLKDRIKQISEDIIREQENQKDAEAALERLTAEQTRLQAIDQDGGTAEKDAKASLEENSRAASDAEQKYDELNEKMLSAKARRSSLESDRLALVRRKDQVEADLARTNQVLNASPSDETFKKRITEAQEKVVAAEQTRDDVVVKLETASKNSRQAADNDSDKASSFSEKKAAVKTISGEINTLKKLLSRSSGSVRQPILDNVKVEPGYEVAFGAALGGDVTAGSDPSEERYWRELEKLDAAKWPAGAVPLVDHVQSPVELMRRLQFVAVVDDEETAKQVHEMLQPGQVLVTRDGGVWRWDGFVRQAGVDTGAAERLERQNQLEQLTIALEEAETAAVLAKTEAEAAHQAYNEIREQEKQLSRQLQEAEKALSAERSAVIRTQEEISRQSSQINGLKETKARYDTELAEIAARMEQAIEALDELPETTELEAALMECRAKVESLREQLASKRAAYDSLKREADIRRNRLGVIADEQTAWQDRKARAVTQLSELGERTNESERELKAVETHPDNDEAKEHAIIQNIDATEIARRDAVKHLQIAEAQLAACTSAVKAAEASRAQYREEEVRAEAQLEAGSGRRKDIARQIGERFGVAPTEVFEKVGIAEDEKLPEPMVLENKIDKFKAERERLGSVNLRADEELNEIEEQFGHLKSERTDLESAISRLRGAIGSLNKEGRERLLAAFELVNGHFSDLFKTLFGGGEAHLKLTDSEDPLQAGLEIFASPPGKKLQALSLLSGGEQALTATSLIFAVFMTNPAPICVLDEVDAPLDDANVERFCNLLDEMIARTDTRFLIVTHNAVTMSRMNRLFGVTMAERGVSTLVSVDLESAEAIAAE